MTYKRDWDKNKPEDHLLIAEIPQVFRWLKEDIAQRLKDWIYGFILGESKVGLKKAPLVSQSSDPDYESDKGILYVKEINGIKELFYRDSSGNVKQLTSQGKLNLTDEGVVYLTGDQTINGVKTFTDGLKAPNPSSNDDVATKEYVDNLPHPDEKVKASSTDSTAGYLDSKVDNTTIYVNGDKLTVKNGGISSSKMSYFTAGNIVLLSSVSEVIVYNTDSEPNHRKVVKRAYIGTRGGKFRISYTCKQIHWPGNVYIYIVVNEEIKHTYHIGGSDSHTITYDLTENATAPVTIDIQAKVTDQGQVRITNFYVKVGNNIDTILIG